MDLSDLLEREHPLAMLEGWLREAAAGQGRLALISGEAGVGKTSLVGRFCRDAHGRARVLRGSCDALSTPRPLGPLHDIAVAAGGELDRLLIQAAPRDRVFRAALTELSGGLTPTLAVIEDAHWADEATLDLLRFLGRRLEPVRSFVIVTYRDDEVGPHHPLRLVMGDLATTKSVRRLNLAPLSEKGIRELAAGSGLDPSSLHRLTGGNPFFASEVIADEAASAGIPATVRDAVLARSSRLTPAGRDALNAAAVIGSPIDADLLIEVAGATAQAIEACLAGGMLVAVGRAYAFRHELARTAIYDAISPPRRRQLHAAVLSALRAASEAGQDVTRLAHHAEAAGDRQAVLMYAPAAARRAAALGANREATAQYARALRFAAGLPPARRLVLLEAYADASDLAGSGTAAVATREEMIALARQSGDQLKETEHLGWLADTLAVDGQYAGAERAADAALAALAGLPEGSAHARAYYHQAYVRLLGGDVRTAVTWGERAVALATRLGDVRSLVFGLHTVGEARLLDGDEERGRDGLERCVGVAREAGLGGIVTATLANLGIGHARIYRFDLADRYLTEAIASATERDDDNWRHLSVAWLAQTRLFQGNWTDATDLAASVLRVPVGVIDNDAGRDPLPVSLLFGIPAYVRIVALLALGRVRARRGDPGADDLLAEALALAGPNAPFRRLAPIRAGRAEAAWLAGDRARAVAEIRAALDGTVGHRPRWLEGELASWLWRTGEVVAPPPGAATPYVRQIEGNWAAAAAGWEALACPYDAALALLDGDEAALRQALEIFERLGARPAEAIATRRLRAMGARGIPRGPRPSTRANPANLTGRELEILPLLAAGRRNTEIAERLFLSPKTVDHHIGSILAKLGVHSRTDVAAAARHFGLFLPDQDRESVPPK